MERLTVLVDGAAQGYLSNMLRHSNRDARTRLIPRDDCAPLASFVHRLLTFRPVGQAIQATEPLAEEDTDFVSIYTFRPGGIVATRLDCAAEIESRKKQENQDCSNIIVLRGYPHLQSLCKVGAAYNISPVLYQRHMHYLMVNKLGGGSLYAMPVLPSFCNNTTIFQLNVTTILHSRSSRLPEDRLGDVGDMRQGCAEQLRRYHRKLAYCQAAPGDSVVQQYSLLSSTSSATDQISTLSAIDQTITIGFIPTPTAWTGMSHSSRETQKSVADGGHHTQAVVWLDSARDLERSLPGPWRQYDPVSTTSSVPATGVTHGHHSTQRPQRDRLGIPQQKDMAEPLSGGSQSSTAAWERTPGHPTASAADFPQDMGRLFNNNNMGRDALLS